MGEPVKVAMNQVNTSLTENHTPRVKLTISNNLTNEDADLGNGEDVAYPRDSLLIRPKHAKSTQGDLLVPLTTPLPGVGVIVDVVV